jgi:putative transposase
LDRGRSARIAASAPGAGESGWRSRGYLPHLDAPNLVQHVVFRLADSLPPHLREEFARKSPPERVETADRILDEGFGDEALADLWIAHLAQQALLHFDGERYALIAWCIMPTHIHALVEVWPGYRLDRIVHSWKSFTAHAVRHLWRKGGPFWAREYFDRYMRDDLQLELTRAYIENNPVKAGLCTEPQDWPFSSASAR